ncbi:MAG: hypothetical protein PHY93_10560 [Bacteriovorax sp.]|nr:hypothetical protein [Bacteriovorax sp.]
MRKSLFLIANFLLATCLVSCAKEEFAANKTPQNSTINALATTSNVLCSQSTLVSPKVDLLLLWDNSSSALFINPATKNSFNQLITSVSEKFDYHILSAPLISTNATNSLYEASLVAKDSSSVSGTASGIIKSKDQAASSLSFTQGPAAEPGVDRATSLIEANRGNGIFRSDAYTIIVVMSNGDDTSCETETGYKPCSDATAISRLKSKIDKLLCLRGHTSGIDCSATNPLNSTMMRFINIAPLTSCSSGVYKTNTRYRKVAKTIYDTAYTKYPSETSAWPNPNDNLNPFISGGVQYPDNYDICSIDFNHIFDGVNTAIKQTLIKHIYEYWPVAGSSASIDADTLRVVRSSDGKVLVNRTNDSNPTDGFQYIGDQAYPGHNTRLYPTQGEPYVGKMIKLIGTATSNGGVYSVTNGDLVTYPECLNVTYDAIKAQYGYIYLKNGEPYVPTIEVRINGALVPQNATNGWDYMGLQFSSSLDPSLKVVDLPSGATSGYFLRLNGSYKFNNTAGAAVTVNVYYTSKAN